MIWAPARERAVIHVNVADFAVAVERVVDPRLQGRPVVVAAPSAARSLVYDMSDEAFREGVRKNMPLAQARKRCRDARVVPPRPGQYETAMRALLEHVRPYTPLIEAGEGNGHLFLDVTGTSRLFGPPADVALRIHRAVKADLGLDPIWSLARNKLVAKVASRLVKPCGDYVVPPGGEESLLAPLPVHLLPGIERDDTLAFREYHVTRVGEAALWTPEQLTVVFGRRGPVMFRAFRGEDESPVCPESHQPPRIVQEHEFHEDTNDRPKIEAALWTLTEQLGAELRRRAKVARRVLVRVEYADGARCARQRSANPGTARDDALFGLAASALHLAWFRRVRLRRIRLTGDRLTEPPAQLELFPDENDDTVPNQNLLAALDRIRAKFGAAAIQRGRAHPREEEWGDPLKRVAPTPPPKFLVRDVVGSSPGTPADSPQHP